MISKQVLQALENKSNQDKARDLQRFFKTGRGEYAEGDIFLGIIVPDIRTIAHAYEKIDLGELKKLIGSPLHEVRFCALVILINRFKKAITEKEAESYFTFYMKALKAGSINNWDLIDVSAPTLGRYLIAQRDYLSTVHTLAKDKNLWVKRASILFTFASLRMGDTKPTLKMAKILLDDEHDLLHKAVGWALREVGKINPAELRDFLHRYGNKMSRTTLRYAIEKFSAKERKKWLVITR